MIKSVILDIDQTIYNSSSLSDAYFDAMIAIVSKNFAVNKSDANNLFRVKREEIRRAGTVISSTQVLIGLGISVKEWIEFSCLMVDPRKYLEPDRNVIRTLGWLCSNLRVAIISNNNSTQLARTYEALGVSNYLMGLRTFSLAEDGRLKPDITLFEDAARYLQVPPYNILAIGDRVDIDLIPARSLGMQTFQVRSLEDFCSIDEYIKQCD